MTTAIEYALLAGAAYYDTRTDKNRLPLPQNWSYVSRIQQDLTTGFEASAFTNGTDIVISFAGTYDNPLNPLTNPDLQADIGLATGLGSAQLLQAAQYYLTVKRLNPSANITLTGHSLGGGLAALVGVFFGVSATTFDQAPFANTAEKNLLTADAAALLKADLLASGYTATELGGLTNFLQSRDANGGIPNSNLINTIRVEGEFLSVFPLNLYDPIGNPATLIQHAPTTVSGTELHSVALLTAFLQSQQTATAGKALNDVTYKLTDLLAMLFDKNLYSFDTDKSDENLLERLVRHEAGVGATATGSAILADAMLTRFTADLWKVAQDGGFTLTNKDIANTLVAFAMQMYYENPKAAVAGKTLFADVAGGLRFDRTDVAAKLSDAKGWQLYFQNYLNTLTLEEHRIVLKLLPATTDWFIQAGSVSLSVTADIGKAFMVGGIGNDWMVGGSEADLLIGNAGDDHLGGGTNNDTLFGEAGDDILQGGSEDDVLTGGAGDDILDGSAGKDTYLNVMGDDVIDDTEGHDTIELVAATGLGAGGLSVVNTGNQGQYRQLNVALYAAYAKVDFTVSNAGNDGAWKEAA